MSQATVSPRVGGRVKDASSRRRLSRSALRPILMLGGIAVVIVGVGYYWLTGGRVVSIDERLLLAGKEPMFAEEAGVVDSPMGGADNFDFTVGDTDAIREEPVLEDRLSATRHGREEPAGITHETPASAASSVHGHAVNGTMRDKGKKGLKERVGNQIGRLKVKK